MKKAFIVTLILSAFTLTACDNAAQKRREECTKAQNDATDALVGRATSQVGHAAREQWDKLGCHQTDVITH